MKNSLAVLCVPPRGCHLPASCGHCPVQMYITTYRNFHGETEAGGCSQRWRSEEIAWSWQGRQTLLMVAGRKEQPEMRRRPPGAAASFSLAIRPWLGPPWDLRKRLSIIAIARPCIPAPASPTPLYASPPFSAEKGPLSLFSCFIFILPFDLGHLPPCRCCQPFCPSISIVLEPYSGAPCGNQAG